MRVFSILICLLGVQYSYASSATCRDLFAKVTIAGTVIEALDDFQATLGALSVPQLLTYSTSYSQRGKAFNIQALSTLLEDAPSDELSKIFKRLHKESKSFKDRLGFFDIPFDIEKTVQNQFDELKKSTSDPEALKQSSLLLDLYKQKAAVMKSERHAILVDFLAAENWMNLNSPVSKAKRRLLAEKWVNEKKLAGTVRKTIYEHVRSTRNFVDSDLKKLSKKKIWTYKEIEDVFHEARREIRWIAKLMLAFPQLVHLEFPLAPTAFETELINRMKNSPLLGFSGDKGAEYVVSVDAVAYFKIIDWSDRLGKFKDVAEARYYFPKLLDPNSEFVFGAEDEARPLLEEIIRSSAFKEVERAFKDFKMGLD
jgi:hypothetical protein